MDRMAWWVGRAGLAGALATLLTVPMSVPAVAGEQLVGPVPARVLEVIDGDTIRVEAQVWLDQRLVILVRLAGIDTPEMKAKCDAERAHAAAARAHLVQELAGGTVTLADIRYGKYAGRVTATVRNDAGADIAQDLLAGGYARPYSGGRRGDWCSLAQNTPYAVESVLSKHLDFTR